MKKFYLSKISLSNQQINISDIFKTIIFTKEQNETITFKNKEKEYLYTLESYINEDFYYLFCEGGQDSPYNDKVLDKNTKIIEPNPRKKSKIELSKYFYYVIDMKYENIMRMHNSDKLMKHVFQDKGNASIDLLACINDIDEFLADLSELTEVNFHGTISNQQELFGGNGTFTRDCIDGLFFAEGSKLQLKIQANKKIFSDPLIKFKKEIKNKNIQFIDIKGKNENSEWISFIHNKASLSNEFNDSDKDKLFESLKEFLLSWRKDNVK